MWAGGQERTLVWGVLDLVGRKIQEPLKEGRVHGGICRTEEDEGKR